MDEAASERATAQETRIRQADPHATSARYLATGSRLGVQSRSVMVHHRR
jgi:hypothetical protein